MKLEYNLPFKEYQEREGVNHSLLKMIFPPNTPLDYQWAWRYPAKKKSNAMDFGSAVHIAVFEHDKFDESVIVAPDIDKRTKAGKTEWEEFLLMAQDKIVLTQYQLDSCYYIIDNIKSHKILGNLMEYSEKKTEVSGFYNDRNIDFKFRTDFIIENAELICDLKTTKAGHERAFSHSVLDFCYHTQAAFYLNGMSRITKKIWSNFLWIVIESEPPHKIYVYEPDPQWLLSANQIIETAINTLKDCREKNSFPGVPQEITTITAPYWMSK